MPEGPDGRPSRDQSLKRPWFHVERPKNLEYGGWDSGQVYSGVIESSIISTWPPVARCLLGHHM